MKLKNIYIHMGAILGLHAVISPYNTEGMHKKLFLTNQLEKKSFLGDNTIWSIEKLDSSYRIRSSDRYWTAVRSKIVLKSGGSALRRLDGREHQNILVSILGDNTTANDMYKRRKVKSAKPAKSEIENDSGFEEEKTEAPEEKTEEKIEEKEASKEVQEASGEDNPEDESGIKYPIVEKSEEAEKPEEAAEPAAAAGEPEESKAGSSLISQLETIIDQLKGNKNRSNARPTSEGATKTTSVHHKKKKKSRSGMNKYLGVIDNLPDFMGTEDLGFDFQLVPVFKNDVDKASVIFNVKANGCVNNRLKIVKCDINDFDGLHASNEDIFWEILPMENPKFLKALKVYLTKENDKVRKIEEQALCFQTLKSECEARMCPPAEKKTGCGEKAANPSSPCCPKNQKQEITRTFPIQSTNCNFIPRDMLSFQQNFSPNCQPITKEQKKCQALDKMQPLTRLVTSPCEQGYNPYGQKPFYGGQQNAPIQSSDPYLQNNSDLFRGILNTVTPASA